MQFLFKNLNNIQTQLITFGNPFDGNCSDVIICITGNPGLPDFYIEFGAELHKSTGYPVCIIGQAGHIMVPNADSNILEKQEHLFDLNGQLAHKLDLINNHIDKNSKLHLIGHSIGAWMILELLEKHEPISKRVSSINLLFPTLQRMAETRNGKFLNGIIRRINFIVILILSLVYMLPESVRSFLIGLYLKYNSLPPHYTERVLKYLNPLVCEKVTFLAYHELDEVVALNTKAIDKVKHIMNIIYSSNDGWVPVNYLDDLKPYQPQLQMKQVDVDHAFVLKSSEKVADMVVEFILSK